MTKAFNSSSVISAVSDSLTLIIMVGLTFASAATLATPTVEPVIHTLPKVEITVHKFQLPTVVVTAKRHS